MSERVCRGGESEREKNRAEIHFNIKKKHMHPYVVN